jgi:hypothetical protein
MPNGSGFNFVEPASLFRHGFLLYSRTILDNLGLCLPYRVIEAMLGAPKRANGIRGRHDEI